MIDWKLGVEGQAERVEDDFWFLARAAAWVAMSIPGLRKMRKKQSLKGEQKVRGDLADDGD